MYSIVLVFYPMKRDKKIYLEENNKKYFYLAEFI